MKKILFLIILFFPIFVFAEKINYDKIAKVETLYLTDFAMDSNNNYYLTGGDQAPGYGVHNGFLYKYNANKELVLSKELEDFEYCYSVFVGNDDSVYALCTKTKVFESNEVDYLPDLNRYDQSYIIKFTNNLEIEYAKTFVGEKDISSVGCVFVKDGYIYYLSTESIFDSYLRTESDRAYYRYNVTQYLYKLDLNGNLIYKKPVTGTTESERSYYVTTPSSSGGGSLAAPSRTVLMEDDSFYFVWSGTVYKCDYNGNVKLLI